jgi:hypothetical protein
MLYAIPASLAAPVLKYRIRVNAIGVGIEAFTTVHCFPGVYELLAPVIFCLLRACHLHVGQTFVTLSPNQDSSEITNSSAPLETPSRE